MPSRCCKFRSLLAAVVLTMSLWGCGSGTESPSDKPQTSSVLRVATTTSTRDSGLLDVLLPVFEEKYSCRADPIAVGTGAALKLGENGDVDVIFCHAPAAEQMFMQARHGIRRERVMHNFFLIAGPEDDPAGIRGLDPVDALVRIAEGKQRFLSRGDRSGTHMMELELWDEAGLEPDWNGYIESGEGQGGTLRKADEMNAYVMTDKGTWLKYRESLRLVPLITEDESLKNKYSVLVVDPQKHPSIDARLADAFADFLISPDAQQLIAGYTVDGQPLFRPDRLSEETAE